MRTPARLFHALLAVTLAVIAGVLVPVASVSAQSKYVPAPVYCADNGVKQLCPVIPSFIGPDPIVTNGKVGYEGLSNDVTSPANDAQTPFDNMSWQMFIALNWLAGQSKTDPKVGLSGAGKVLWQTYARPEDVFGGPPGKCANPKNLPRFNLIAKSGAQGSRDEEFQQATGQPLIDVNGNWTLFERRLNAVEQTYILKHGLNTYDGQRRFIEGGGKVALPPGDATKTNGAVGAIELKASWRIISPAEKASYFHQQALIDVEGAYVRGGQPLCQEVTLGLTGLHIIQNNAQAGVLLPQFIWATFEHKDNAPLAAAVCDPVDTMCYKKIANNMCPAPTVDAAKYSFHRAACGNAITNVPPKLIGKETAFVWERTAPYAKSYMTQQNGNSCGTQVARCWDVYSLTKKLNKDWHDKLKAINSVFANYFLAGTDWGGKVEPRPGVLVNGSVPAFLGNSTMETYIQADPNVGNCVGCHSFATLAYKKATADPKKPITYPADFSFLLGLPKNLCKDVNAGPILNQAQAQMVCPGVCKTAQRSWNGQWTTTQPGVMSVCGCCSAK